ncbi:phage major capsid protein [Burkholderia sp. Z1]|uniref:phage major capsid protein n=1 Tax=Burkholderia sp. Z1 TaxID=2759039 RepID=UPI001D01D7F0|nr:phage major capsid protein [Burkholderia sp. Z1]
MPAGWPCTTHTKRSSKVRRPPPRRPSTPRTLVGLAVLADTKGRSLAAPSLQSGVRQMATNGVPANLGTGKANSRAFVGNFSTMQFVIRESLNIGVLRDAYAKTGEIGFLCHAHADLTVNYPQGDHHHRRRDERSREGVNQTAARMPNGLGLSRVSASFSAQTARPLTPKKFLAFQTMSI